MRCLLPIFIVVLLAACARDGDPSFETVHLGSGGCEGCPEINISIPEARGRSKIAEAINTALREEVISQLSFEDTVAVETIPQAITSFERVYEQMKRLYPDELAGWKAEILAEITFQDPNWISIRVTSYSFTGGAHGYSFVRYLNFNRPQGREIATWELIANEKDFRTLAENHFRAQLQIPEQDPINSTGFMFEDNTFSLPENIGLTPEGVTLHYNQYEVASYADGPIEVVIPFSEVEAYLAKPSKS